MAALNFIPTERVKSKKMFAIGRKIKMVAAFSAMICIVIAILATLFLIYKGNELSNLTAKRDTLRQEVVAQENSEQTLVLLRDRLNKIQLLSNKYQTNAAFLSVRDLISSFSEGVTFRQLELGNGRPSSLAAIAKDSVSLGTLISLVLANELGEASVLEALTFSQSVGFQANFIMN